MDIADYVLHKAIKILIEDHGYTEEEALKLMIGHIYLNYMYDQYELVERKCK